MLGHRPLVPEDYLDILKRRWWIVLLPLLILPIVSYSFSYTIPPQYLSQTLVLIEGQKVPENYVKPAVSEDLDSRLASMREQILSRSNLQPILERYNLYANSRMDMDDRIETIRKNIDIKPIHSEIAHSGGLPGFFISFKADDPHTAQLVCSEITTIFTNENLKIREESAQGTTDFLKSQLDEAKHNLDDQDAKLAGFQKQYMGRLPGEEASNSNMLSSLNTQLESANQALARMEQDRSYVQAMLAQQSSQLVIPASGNMPAVQISSPGTDGEQAELQSLQNQEADLLSHYTSDYPDVVAVRRKESELRKKIAQQSANPASSRAPGAPVVTRESPAVQQLRAQLRAADLGIQEKRKEQADLQASIHNYQSRIESSPAVEEEYKLLTRDYQTAQAFYDDLLSKMNQSRMATDLEKRQQSEQFRLMDAANLPDAPFSPKRSVFVVSGAGFGLALGLLISGLLEYRDTSLRSERDVWAFTQLPTLGLIPLATIPQPRGAKTLGRLKRLFRFRKSKQLAGAHG